MSGPKRKPKQHTKKRKSMLSRTKSFRLRQGQLHFTWLMPFYYILVHYRDCFLIYKMVMMKVPSS